GLVTFWSRGGCGGLHCLGQADQAEGWRLLLGPTRQPGRTWDEPLATATMEGRFRVQERVNGTRQVICATGFRRGFRHDPLLTRLVEEHDLETADGWIVLDDDASVPGLTDAKRTLALAGVAAHWAFPAADTLAGARYV